MALKIFNEAGETQFTLFLGQKAEGGHIKEVLTFIRYANASGLELEECLRLLGRPRLNSREHTFDLLSTAEIVLNWGK